jgi:hypothetical protein
MHVHFALTRRAKGQNLGNLRKNALWGDFGAVDIKSKKGKAIPLQAWAGPDVSRRLRFPDLKATGT